MADELQRIEAATRAVDQTSRDRNELAKKIRAGKETIAKSEKLQARLDGILRDLNRK